MSTSPTPVSPATTEPPAGKPAMSNLTQRIIFGVIGAVLLLGSVWYSAWTFALFFGLVQMRMLWEFYRMMREVGYKPAALLGGAISLFVFMGAVYVCALPDYLNDIYIGEQSLGALNPNFIDEDKVLLLKLGFGFFLLLPVILILREMAAWPRENQQFSPFANVGVALLGLLYVSLPMSLLNVLAFTQTGYDYRRIFALLLLVWSSDIGAYAAGKTFGKHKLAPKISPGKTWEGAVGGFLLTLVMGWALGYLLPELSLTYRLVVAGVVAVFGPLGDLAESMLKRSVDIKDSGRIMPGHGGLLDRFDAFLFILPVLALLRLLLG
ncbi:phosphatidate cytidylyltransferase [Hymenobacter sp. 5516J-16]|uniref:phosphatidate cytidylyltransferase n=1 Tax=Hymenobacter sp. 5516J-16 TaxID=2932253 RepID=UPI001FD2FE89|nr:phosphatidate cytidylyltransferase [Hymenobacter sp. 5516J-16]UOQ75501.1 phosphatidate cytidylyltransferase [Hymenobacter sp. 5516J-16]